MSFSNGQRVEVAQIEEGLEGSWFAAKILPLPKKKKNDNRIFYVEYESFFDDKGTNLLREYVDFARLRPLPPEELDSTPRNFEINEEVDAFWNDAWWKGVITNGHSGGLRYSVYFEKTKEESEYDRSDLRTHRDWIDGKWARSKIQETTFTEKEEIGQSHSQRGESSLTSDMGTPQISSGVRDIVVENVMPSSINICEMTYKPSDAKGTDSSSDSKTPTKEWIFKKVRDRLTTKVPIVQECDSRTGSSNAPDVFAFPTIECQRNLTEVDHPKDTGLPKLHGQSHEEHHTVLPMGKTKEDVSSSQKIKLVGEGGLQNQTEMKRKHSKDFGEKTKRRRVEARTACHSQGLNHDSASKENDVVDTECEHMLSHTDEDHQRQPLSICTEIPISPDNGGIPLDGQLISTERDGLTERFILSETSNGVEGVAMKVDAKKMKSSTQCEQHTTDEDHQDQAHSETRISPDNTGGTPVDSQLISTERDGPNGANCDERLGFIKNVWEIIQSIQVFKSIPQHPHFSLLEQENEFHREGYVIGNMLNFANLAERLKRAKLEQPRSVFEDMLQALSDFEKLGFTVDPLRSPLEELIALKDSFSLLDDNSESTKNELISVKSKADEFQESINGATMKLDGVMSEMEMKACKIAERQTTVDAIKHKVESVKLDFDTMVRSLLIC